MTIACPRHGVVDVAKDAPCPDCGVAAYDLDDRNARDVVRNNREAALKGRKQACAFALAVVVTAAVWAFFPVRVVVFGANVVALFAGACAMIFGARPLALKLETRPRLRALDDELARRKV